PYILQSNNLLVFENGVLLDSSSYERITAFSIKLNSPVSVNTTVSAWSFPNDCIKTETLPADSTVDFSQDISNTLIYNNGRLLLKGVDYTINGSTIDFENFDTGVVTAVNFNPSLLIVNQIPRYSTTTFQKDLVIKEGAFSINENLVQLYKN